MLANLDASFAQTKKMWNEASGLHTVVHAGNVCGILKQLLQPMMSSSCLLPGASYG